MEPHLNWLIVLISLTIFIYDAKAHFYPISPPSYLRFKPPIIQQPVHHHSTFNDDSFYINHFNTLDNSYPEFEFESAAVVPPPPVYNTKFYKDFEQFKNENHYYPPHQAIVGDIRHPAVVMSALHESTLPSELKNPFYKNHRIRSALADASWFHHGETIVTDRHAERIPRQEIYKLLINAGFLPKHHY